MNHQIRGSCGFIKYGMRRLGLQHGLRLSRLPRTRKVNSLFTHFLVFCNLILPAVGQRCPNQEGEVQRVKQTPSGLLPSGVLRGSALIGSDSPTQNCLVFVLVLIIYGTYHKSIGLKMPLLRLWLPFVNGISLASQATLLSQFLLHSANDEYLPQPGSSWWVTYEGTSNC